MRAWLRRLLREEQQPLVEGSRTSLYIERPCIGCLRPFKKWGITHIPLIEQFCSPRCKRSFFHGYDLGLRVLGSMSKWPKMGRR